MSYRVKLRQFLFVLFIKLSKCCRPVLRKKIKESYSHIVILKLLKIYKLSKKIRM